MHIILGGMLVLRLIRPRIHPEPLSLLGPEPMYEEQPCVVYRTLLPELLHQKHWLVRLKLSGNFSLLWAKFAIDGPRSVISAV
ncbi:MAG: hypothetical protein CM1200mP35_01930 [Chloroflexota bacterium]|nr:MAG: hypothetical protein CM1200mP35_01930 [Chloroflexota bacterium]